MVKLILRSLSHPWAVELQPGLNRVGRNPTNDLRLPDASVSSFHCEITVDEGAINVRDLCSTNGTFLDGQPITEAPVRCGQILQLGGVQLRVEEEATRVKIPDLPAAAAPAGPVFLADGSPACMHHPALPAAHRCPNCAQFFCESCARPLQVRGGGPARVFCPSCGHACEPVLESPALQKEKAKTFLGRLTQTLKIRSK